MEATQGMWRVLEGGVGYGGKVYVCVCVCCCVLVCVAGGCQNAECNAWGMGWDGGGGEEDESIIWRRGKWGGRKKANKLTQSVRKQRRGCREGGGVVEGRKDAGFFFVQLLFWLSCFFCAAFLWCNTFFWGGGVVCRYFLCYVFFRGSVEERKKKRKTLFFFSSVSFLFFELIAKPEITKCQRAEPYGSSPPPRCWQWKHTRIIFILFCR